MAKKNRKTGILSAGITALVIGVIIMVNIFVTNLDWSYDVSENELYTLSEQTKQLVTENEKELTLYVLSTRPDFDMVFRKIVNEYDKLSDKLTVVYKDLDTYPNFPYEYIDSSSQTAVEGSIIVECGEKFRYLSSEEFVSYSYDYYTYEQVAESIDLESQLTQAINYVISEKTPVVYALTGHDEAEIDSVMEGYFYSDNFELRELDLAAEEQVPEDCAILFVNGPTSDISEEEAEKVLTYLEGDGKMYFAADPLTEDLTHFESILNAYGIRMEKGVVIESEESMYTQAPTYLLPTLGYSKITSPIQEEYVLVPVSKGFFRGEDTEEYTITPLLTTSEYAYSKINIESDVVEQEEEDIEGPFYIALQVDTEEGGKLVAVGSVNLFNEQIDSVVSGTNSDFFMNGINYLAQQEETVSVAVKDLTTNYAEFTASTQKILMLVTTFAIPGVTLLTGILVVVKRRKR